MSSLKRSPKRVHATVLPPSEAIAKAIAQRVLQNSDHLNWNNVSEVL